MNNYKKDIFFSVVICCFNSSEYLNETIESVINQQFQNLINLTGPNIFYVNYNRNKMKWCDMVDKNNIMNQDSIDIIIDLNKELYFDLSKFINDLNSNVKIGFKTVYSDYFYNIQIDIGEDGIIENGFNKIQKILVS